MGIDGPVDVPLGYVPISIEHLTDTNDPVVAMCAVSLADYQAHPSAFPRFDNVVAKQCTSSNTLSVRLSDLDTLDHVTPSGLILHEPKAGGSVVTGMLATNPSFTVYSEPSVLTTAVLKCVGCSTERMVSVLMSLMNGLGNSKHKGKVFVSLHPLLALHLSTIITAFPHTPWTFLFRNPIEIIGLSIQHAIGTSWLSCIVWYSIV